MTASNEDFVELSPDDRRLLDSLAESGFDEGARARLAPADRERAERLVNLLALLNDYPVDATDDDSNDDMGETLVHATLARIVRHEDEAAARMSFDAAADDASIRRRRIRVPDFISVAAVLLIAAGILLPATNYVRQRALDAGCANNLRYVGYAFSQYAGDFDGAMPVSSPGGAWEVHANIANLLPLIGGKYCDLGHLDCPGADTHSASGSSSSYSYQCQQPGEELTWGVEPSAMIVLGDSNPLVDAFLGGKRTDAMAISLNHGGRGQNVLGTDGATLWLEKPVLGRDNIWLPEGESFLHEGARPARGRDIFLVH